LSGAVRSFVGAADAGFVPDLAAGGAADLIVVGQRTIWRGQSAELTIEHEMIARANVSVKTIPATICRRVSGFT
jgi:hypothetical protein